MNGPQNSGTRSARILLAEDNEINQRVVCDMLEHKGYGVRAVYNGKQALDTLESGHYDLVIMDCLMPVMDGYAATQAIRASTSGAFDPQIPVLAITALAAPGDREKCLAAGMNAYISKPVIAKILFTKVQRLLKRTAEPTAETEQDSQAALAGILRSMSGRLLADIACWRADLARLAMEGAVAELGMLAHTIRGTADVLGESRLSAAAATLEGSARNNRSEPLGHLAAELNVELQSLERSLRKPP
jgi:CheY-like chemotaxis protein/HPt (histidine-containing phosphotransfer) domain-containing protein